MANEWADKDLPRAQRNIAPAVYDENKEEWVVVLGRDGRQFVRDDSVERQLKELNETMGGNMDVSDKDVKAELQSIKDTQGQIINALKQTNEALKGTINTQLTGSYVEDEDAIPVDQLTRNIKVISIDASTKDTISAKSDKKWDIYAPKGWMIKEIVDLRMQVDMPEGNSSGDHLLSLGRTVLNSKFSAGNYALTSGRTNKAITFNAGTGFDTEDSAFPNKSSEVLLAYKLLSFDDQTPIQAYYSNRTDVDQAYKIDIQIKCIAEKKVG